MPLCKARQCSGRPDRFLAGSNVVLVWLQAMIIAETYMDHIARALGKPPAAVRALNMYKEGDRTHFGQVLEGCQVTDARVLCLLAVAGIWQLVRYEKRQLW